MLIWNQSQGPIWWKKTLTLTSGLPTFTHVLWHAHEHTHTHTNTVFKKTPTWLLIIAHVSLWNLSCVTIQSKPWPRWSRMFLVHTTHKAHRPTVKYCSYEYCVCSSSIFSSSLLLSRRLLCLLLFLFLFRISLSFYLILWRISEFHHGKFRQEWQNFHKSGFQISCSNPSWDKGLSKPLEGSSGPVQG